MPPSDTDRIERSIVIQAPRARVWQALSDAETFGRWFGCDLRGQRFEAGQRTQGPISIEGYSHLKFDVVVESIEPERAITWRWHPYPMDPAARVVRDDSRLNQVLLVRLDPSQLNPDTRARAADGIVACSAVCTHTGCDAWDWQPGSSSIKCPCHFSEFDLRQSAQVMNGPAPRRLPALPLKVVENVPVVAGSFVGRPGFETGG